jgi:hypothetical protein
MIRTTATHSINSARILGHRFRHVHFVPFPWPDSSSESVSAVSSSSSLLSSRASSGVSSVVRLDGCDSREREDRPDFWEAGREGRELGAVESMFCTSFAVKKDTKKRYIGSVVKRSGEQCRRHHGLAPAARPETDKRRYPRFPIAALITVGRRMTRQLTMSPNILVSSA